MSAEQREEDIFDAALKLPCDQRAAYLGETCEADADLRRRVEGLLGAFERAGGFMNQRATPERATRLSPPHTEMPGERVGHYKLLEKLGEGGCGVVYVAEQEEPVRRRVALKVIKLGMDTKQVIARFDAERQALAMMDHPNIAKIHDAGVTQTGRPYFVMELVRGNKITDYFEEHQLSPRERLDLFIQVCRAIQHAHQKGVIHRDIKPSNILVTLHDGVPVPKVIDFGIAKATQGRLTDQTVYTAFEQFIGTPAYMSPEQAEMSGLDIDTRSDIYSLGVLLYELLTGTTPFDAKELLSKGLDEMRRTIREREPMKPSRRLTQELATFTARGREKVGDAAALASESHLPSFPPAHFQHRPRHDPHELQRLIPALRGDLDWIIMKCLEKDRTRRYETANSLASDIARHLNNEPVLARPPSKLYRFRKSVQRNRPAYIATTAFFLLLVAGTIISTSQAIRATRAEQEQIQLRKLAEANERKAQAEAARGSRAAHGSLYLQQRNWHAAAEEYAQSIEIDPADPLADHLKSFQVAIALLESGKTNEYLQQCRKMIARYKKTDDLYIAERVAKACLLLPVDGSEFETACKLADFAAITRKESPWNCETKAFAEYRCAHYSSATNWIVLSLSNTAIEPPCRAAVLFLEASAFARLTDFPSARIALEEGDQVVQEYATTSGLHLGWWDWMIADILRGEAKALLESQTNSAAEKKNDPR